MPAATETETLIFEGDALKTLPDAPEGKVKVGGYAARFADENEPDFAGEFFTKNTNFGPRDGDGQWALFHHGQPLKAFDRLCDRNFGTVKVTKDDAGLFAEVILDAHDEYEAVVAEMCARGKLKWSSGSSGHMVRKSESGEITRWPISEFSFTPTPAEPRLPAIRPLKSLAEPAPVVDTPKTPVTSPAKITVMDKTPAELAAERQAEIDKAVKAATDKAGADFKVRREEDAEILAIGEETHCLDAAKSYVRDGKSAADFRKYVLAEVLKARPVPLNAGIVGLSDQDVKDFSLLKAVQAISLGKSLTGHELAVHNAAVKLWQGEVNERTIIVPEDVKRSWSAVKAQNVTTATAGGFLVQQQYMPIIELLRNKTRVIEAGATQLGGLVGDVIIPQHVSGAVAYWVSETGALTDSQSVFAQKKMTPHRLGATIPYSTQFLAQASVDAESFIRNDATMVLGIEVDRSALLGSGVGGEPLGLANSTDAILGSGRGINQTVTFGGAPAWADIVEFETGIADDNADFDTMAFIMGVTTVGKMKTVLKDSVAGAQYLLGDNMMSNGYRVLRSKQVGTAQQVFFGAWSQLILGSWAGMSVIVDPYALKKSGQVEITFNEMRDVLVRQPLAFNVSTDAGNQS